MEIPMDAEYLQGFYLGDLLVEPLKGRVSGKNGEHHLPPKAAEVLLCLARHAGDIVPHEELLKCAWGEGNGNREGLSHTIGEIRHALGDHAEDPHFVQTLPRLGYRLLINPVPIDEHSGSIILGAGGDSPMHELGLFESLQRRGVIETGIAYLFFGWLIIQVADVIFDRVNLPDWSTTFVIVLVGLGFPIAIVLSWFLEFRDGNAVLDDLSPKDRRRRRFGRTYISIVSALAAAAVLVWVFRLVDLFPQPEPPLAALATPDLPIAENSIAVLPFLNNDGSQETQIFANGLMDDVITRLSRVPGLLVSSRGDAATLAPNTPSETVRKRLRVAMYLEGSVEMSGDKIRVIMQLIDSSTSYHRLSRSFDRPKENFFDIRDEITELTVSSLRVSLPDSLRDLTPPSENQPAFDVYVQYRRGMDELDKRRSEESIAAALSWFDAVLSVDPEFAAAYAGRCKALVSEYEYSKDSHHMTEAEGACFRALELNPNLDVVHTALGDLYRYTGRYADSSHANEEALRINPQNVAALLGLSEAQRLLNEPDKAEQTLRRAIGLQPGNWQPYAALGDFLYRRGRYEEAAEQFLTVVTLDDTNLRGLSNAATSYMMAGRFDLALPAYRRAIEVQPDPRTYVNLGLMHYYLGNYDGAIDALRIAISLNPRRHLTWMNLGDVLFVSARPGEARDAFARANTLLRESLEVNPNEPTLLMDLAWIQAMLGNPNDSLLTISRTKEAAPDDPYSWFIAALVHNELGDTTAALDNLEISADKGFSRVLIGAEPHLANLQGTAQFSKITRGP